VILKATTETKAVVLFSGVAILQGSTFQFFIDFGVIFFATTGSLAVSKCSKNTATARLK